MGRRACIARVSAMALQARRRPSTAPSNLTPSSLPTPTLPRVPHPPHPHPPRPRAGRPARARAGGRGCGQAGEWVRGVGGLSPAQAAPQRRMPAALATAIGLRGVRAPGVLDAQRGHELREGRHHTRLGPPQPHPRVRPRPPQRLPPHHRDLPPPTSPPAPAMTAPTPIRLALLFLPFPPDFLLPLKAQQAPQPRQSGSARPFSRPFFPAFFPTQSAAGPTAAPARMPSSAGMRGRSRTRAHTGWGRGGPHRGAGRGGCR